MSQYSRPAPHSGTARCQLCHLRSRCLPRELDEGELDEFSALICRRGPIERGEILFQVGAPFERFYALQSGSVKTCVRTYDGRTQVMGFHFAGEILGMDALHQGRHPCFAVALEQTWVCMLPFAKLDGLARKTPKLMHTLAELMSCQLAEHEQALMTLAKYTVERRLLRFLLDVQRRSRPRCRPTDEVFLPMNRADIASYLGSTPETISRSFAALRAAKRLDGYGTSVRMLSTDCA